MGGTYGGPSSRFGFTSACWEVKAYLTLKWQTVCSYMKLPDTETFKVLPELLHRMVQIQDIYFLLHLFRVGCKSVGGVGGGWGTGRGLLLERAASLHGCRTCVLGVQKVRTQSCRSVSDSSPHFISAVSDKVCVTWLTYSCIVLFLYCDKPEGRLRLTSDGFRAKQCDLHSKILSCAKMCFRLDVGRFHIRHLFIYKINNVCM